MAKEDKEAKAAKKKAEKEEKEAKKKAEAEEKKKAKEDKKKEKKKAKDDKKSEKNALAEAKKKAAKKAAKKKKGGGDDDPDSEDEAEEKPQDAEGGDGGGGGGDDDDSDDGGGGGGGGRESMDEDADMTAEEAQEELEDLCVRVLQRAYRRKRGRRALREMVRANFVKEYDQETGEFFYKNVRSGAIQHLKPAALGTEDLPDPPVYFAPKGYMASESAVRQFAAVIACNAFSDPKLPNITEAVMKDHEELHATLVHPYLCKYKDEDCVFMRNPTMSGAKGNLEGLKDIVKKAWKLEETFAPKGTKYESHGLLLIYVATHVVNITRGPNAGSYLCFADSNLSSPEAIKKTTITVKNFCKIISKVNCKEKVVFLDIAHGEKPKGGAFSTMQVYPPTDIYREVAKQCDARVIGSCKLGADLFAFGGGAATTKKKKKAPGAAAAPGAKKPAAKGNKRGSKDNKRGSKDAAPDAGGEGAGGEGGEDGAAPALTDLEKELMLAQVVARGFEEDAAREALDAVAWVDIESAAEAAQAAAAEAAGAAAAAAGVDAPKAKKQPPKALVAVGRVALGAARSVGKFARDIANIQLIKVYKDERTGEWEVEDEGQYFGKLPQRFKNWVKRQVRMAKDDLIKRYKAGAERRAAAAVRAAANFEQAHYHGEDGSVFGRACVQALRGSASTPETQYLGRVLAEDTYEFVKKECAKIVDAREAAEEARLEAERKKREEEEGPPKPGAKPEPARLRLTQTVQTAIGRKNSRELDFTTCSLPSPPPPPAPPRAIKVHDRSCNLAWKDPKFSGAAPIQYEVYSLGTAKYDSTDWAQVGKFTTITKPLFQAPHLTPGMAVKFKVRARNHGEWGEFSDESEYIVPTSQPLEPVPVIMQKAAQKGMQYVLLSMTKHAKSAEAQKLGCWQLATTATKARGFKRPALARDTAVVVLEAMNTFVLDAEMQAKGCLVLGWCFYKHLGVARELDKLGVEDTIKKACENFAANVAVNSNAQWALANLHTREEGPGIMGARDAKAIAAITASARAWGE